jgi:hypothetical protein
MEHVSREQKEEQPFLARGEECLQVSSVSGKSNLSWQEEKSVWRCSWCFREDLQVVCGGNGD